MRRSWFLLLPLPLLVLACGGSDAGDVFSDPGAQDTGVATADTGGGGSDTSVPPTDSGTTGEDSDPPPPVDSGMTVEDTTPPPPVDTGLVIDTAPPPVDTGTCTGPGAKTFGGHCYFLTSMTRYWQTSRDACVAAGAHLVTITSSEEQAFVRTSFLTGTGSSEERWIGLYRPDGTAYAASSYRWVGTETGTYRNWGTGEPNFSGQCVRMRSDGTWGDQSCSINILAVCERE